MPATLEIYPADERTEAFLSHNKIQINFGVHVLGMIGHRKPLDIVAFLPAAKFQELAVEEVTSYVTSLENPNYNLVEMAKSQGTVLAVLRLPKNRDELLQEPVSAKERREGRASASPADTAPPAVGLEDSSHSTPMRQPAAEDDPASLLQFTTSLLAARTERLDAQAELQRTEQLHEKRVITQLELQKSKRRYEAAVRRELLADATYQAMLRDLEFQIEAAQVERMAAVKEAALQDAKYAAGDAGVEIVDAAQARIEQAELKRKRLQNRYDLFQKAGEGLVEESFLPPVNHRRFEEKKKPEQDSTLPLTPETKY